MRYRVITSVSVDMLQGMVEQAVNEEGWALQGGISACSGSEWYAQAVVKEEE